MQKTTKSKVSVNLAFKVIGKELLKDGQFDTSFDYLQRSGMKTERAASIVSHAAEKAKKLFEALKFSRFMEDSNATLVRKGMMTLRISQKPEDYNEGVCLLIKGGIGKEKANRLGASFAFRNREFRAAAEMFESANMEKEAKRVWKIVAKSAIRRGNNVIAILALTKAGMDAKKEYKEAAEEFRLKGDFSNASSMFNWAGEHEKSNDMLLLDNRYDIIIKNMVMFDKLKVKEACASVAQKLETLGNLEAAANCYELAFNFEKAKELYRKAGNEEEAKLIEKVREPNKGWYYISKYEKLGFSREECE